MGFRALALKFAAFKKYLPTPLCALKVVAYDSGVEVPMRRQSKKTRIKRFLFSVSQYAVALGVLVSLSSLMVNVKTLATKSAAPLRSVAYIIPLPAENVTVSDNVTVTVRRH
jgi:hypothetical protein